MQLYCFEAPKIVRGVISRNEEFGRLSVSLYDNQRLCFHLLRKLVSPSRSLCCIVYFTGVGYFMDVGGEVVDLLLTMKVLYFGFTIYPRCTFCMYS